MSKYVVKYKRQAEKDILFWRKNSPKDYRKLMGIIDELAEHPYTGTGWPEYLQGDEKCWSRHINKKDVIKYEIHDREVYVFVISARGHYDDH